MSSPRVVLRGVSIIEVVGAVLAMAAGGVGLAQEQPAASAPKAAPSKAAEPPSFELLLMHVLPAGGECAPKAAGVCRSLAHWQVEVKMPYVDAPAVVPLMAFEDLRRVLGDAKKDKEEVGPSGITFFRNAVALRAPPQAPYFAVQRVIQVASRSGFYKIDAAASEAAANEREPAPVEGTATQDPVIDDALRATLAGPELLHIALFCDPTSGACVRRIGSLVLPCSANGDRQVRAMLQAAANERARQRHPCKVEIDAAGVVPWARFMRLLVLCKEQGAMDIQFGRLDVLPPEPRADELKKAFVTGDGWRPLGLDDFVNVNGDADTWTERDGVIVGTGKPLGGARTKQQLTNFELVLEWRHHEVGGNSGVFVWCPESAFTDLPRGKLPRSGIEVQVLDLGYEEQWLQDKGTRADWFTSHGDVFPVGESTMSPFTPQITYELSGGELVTVGNEKSSRCFPQQRLVRPAGEWNHYYVRAINGEVRLWVNGAEVSGGSRCNPARGYLALEAEGAKIEFRNLRLRELP